jgi:hypothetical protein
MAYNDSEGLLIHDTVVGIFQGYFNRDFLTAILNSKFISWLAYNIIYCRAVRTMDFIDFYVSQLPIPRISFTTSKGKKEKLVNEAMAMYGNKDYSTLLNVIIENLKSKPNEFDVVYDILAFLARKMREMNKEKQKLTNEFLGWLENEVIKQLIDNLKNKTKLENFYDYTFESIIEVLKLNKLLPKLIRPEDYRYKILRTTFDRTMSKLNPLILKINETDNLIDQIIYKLYGLTGEEIKIIEGG